MWVRICLKRECHRDKVETMASEKWNNLNSLSSATVLRSVFWTLIVLLVIYWLLSGLSLFFFVPDILFYISPVFVIIPWFVTVYSVVHTIKPSRKDFQKIYAELGKQKGPSISDFYMGGKKWVEREWKEKWKGISEKWNEVCKMWNENNEKKLPQIEIKQPMTNEDLYKILCEIRDNIPTTLKNWVEEIKAWDNEKSNYVNMIDNIQDDSTDVEHWVGRIQNITKELEEFIENYFSDDAQAKKECLEKIGEFLKESIAIENALTQWIKYWENIGRISEEIISGEMNVCNFVKNCISTDRKNVEQIIEIYNTLRLDLHLDLIEYIKRNDIDGLKKIVDELQNSIIVHINTVKTYKEKISTYKSIFDVNINESQIENTHMSSKEDLAVPNWKNLEVIKEIYDRYNSAKEAHNEVMRKICCVVFCAWIDAMTETIKIKVDDINNRIASVEERSYKLVLDTKFWENKKVTELIENIRKYGRENKEGVLNQLNAISYDIEILSQVWKHLGDLEKEVNAIFEFGPLEKREWFYCLFPTGCKKVAILINDDGRDNDKRTEDDIIIKRIASMGEDEFYSCFVETYKVGKDDLPSARMEPYCMGYYYGGIDEEKLEELKKDFGVEFTEIKDIQDFLECKKTIEEKITECVSRGQGG